MGLHSQQFSSSVEDNVTTGYSWVISFAVVLIYPRRYPPLCIGQSFKWTPVLCRYGRKRKEYSINERILTMVIRIISLYFVWADIGLIQKNILQLGDVSFICSNYGCGYFSHLHLKFHDLPIDCRALCPLKHAFRLKNFSSYPAVNTSSLQSGKDRWWKISIYCKNHTKPMLPFCEESTALWARSKNYEQRLSASSCLFVCMSVCLSVCLFVRMKHLDFKLTRFHAIWYLTVFQTLSRKLKFDCNLTRMMVLYMKTYVHLW
jgi:hypothetical protein